MVTSDSGAYISNGYTLYVPLDRPLGYSIFLRLFSLGFSVWGAVLIQSIILSFFIRLLAKYFLGSHYNNHLFIGIVLALTFATSASWFVSQIMPDIFTAILLLAILSWYLIPSLSKGQNALLLTFIYAVLLQHNSNALILIGFTIMSVVSSIFRRNRKDTKRHSIILSIGLAALLTLSFMNFAAGKGFRASAGTHVFLMCRLVESGIMDKFLSENCATNEYKLCAYRDQLPNRQWDFMWDENSALNKTGGWEANEQEYSKIERKIFTTPNYLMLFIFKSAQATLRQLPQIYIGDGLSHMGEGSSPYNNISQYRRSELKEYSASLQNTSGLPFNFFNGVIVTVALVLAIGVLFSWTQESVSNEWRRGFEISILYICCNAAVTATFSTVLGRFQARVFWVIPFFCLLFLLRNFLQWKQYKKIS